MKEDALIDVPPAPKAGAQHDFHLGEVRIWALLDSAQTFSVCRQRVRNLGVHWSRPEVTVLGIFRDWPAAWRCGERAARIEEQREVDAGYAASFPRQRKFER